MYLATYGEIILAFAKELYVNGQTTTQVVRESKRLADHLNLQVDVFVSWGEVQLKIEDQQTKEKYYCTTSACPTGVHMGRVIALLNTLQALYIGKITLEHASKRLEEIRVLPPAPSWLFALAAAMGATALGVIFGVTHWYAAFLIFLSAGIGGKLRRYIAGMSVNIFIQPFVAALVSGIIGALAVRYELSSTLRLVAVCPCMVLVPGPHFLNSALDFIHGRILLGLARLNYACLVIVAISTGLWIGLNMFGVGLPIDPKISIEIPIWQDMLAAGIAVTAYSIFFSTPLKMIAWPIIIGMLAHMLRWKAMMSFGVGIIGASFLACLLVGAILSYVAYRNYMPFAAFGFSAVVSMIPGVFLFRMTSGLVQLSSGSNITLPLLSETIFDGITAVFITFAISLGLLAPKLILDYLLLSTPE